MNKTPNFLIKETSPYLLQHAYNPVNWYAWNEESLNQAKKQNKLMLISIGYSACHWCHVMEHESFEDETVAKIMNDYFVNIKVDREERPDIDQVYMTAVQIMTQRGGWPLNCFALPDGRPIYGGTYFAKDQWINILLNLADLWKTEPEKAVDYAAQLTEGIKRSDIIQLKPTVKFFKTEIVVNAVENWKKNFDTTNGGMDYAPKFLMPNNLLFFLRYSHLFNDEQVKAQLHLTLKKMAYGGIYDQIAGGFARYSTDMEWKVPHFEKMLYDNAQLISVYSEAYRASKNELYKQIVFETIDFIEQNMTSPEGGFYSAIDADSEGEEGKFYIWKIEELKEILGGRFELTADYFNINENGLWEHENYILLRNSDDETIANKYGLTIEQLKSEVKLMKKNLLHYRNKRTSPGLDDKILTSWNALMVKGLIDAYCAFNEQRFLKLAIKNIEFTTEKQSRADGRLNHSYKESKSTINGFLEDYCFTIEALISLYEATFDKQWLLRAKQLTDYSIECFYNETSGMFYFTSKLDKELITRKFEIHDNVIPASNSCMARNLFYLSKYFNKMQYGDMSHKMLSNVVDQIPSYGSGYSNWLLLLLHHIKPFYEIAIVGKDVNEKRLELAKTYLPNKIFAGSATEDEVVLTKDRYIANKTLVYVCENKSCFNPTEKVEEALKNISFE